jgi:hypothetical protein
LNPELRNRLIYILEIDWNPKTNFLKKIYLYKGFYVNFEQFRASQKCFKESLPSLTLVQHLGEFSLVSCLY